jgi:hypothetical protein
MYRPHETQRLPLESLFGLTSVDLRSSLPAIGRTDAVRHRSIDREFDSANTKIQYLLMGEFADLHSQAIEKAVLKRKEVPGSC